MQGRKLLQYFLLAVGFLLLLSGPLLAQEDSAPVEVYVMRTPPGAEDGVARLLFVNPVSGEASSVDVRGERFTVLGGYALYADPDSGAIMRAWPDGRLEPHPFIQRDVETQAVRWVVSPNRGWIAWTLINQATDTELATVTSLARADGSEQRIILLDGPDAFFHVEPLALTDDGVLFFDRQPEGVAGLLFYPQYAALSRLVPGQEPALLPFEPNCYCGAGLSSNGRFFARLERVADDGGYEIRLWDLTTSRDTLFPMLPVPPLPYPLAGSVLVAPDGGRVVYSLANGLTIDSAGTGREQFMIAVAAVAEGAQVPALESPLRAPLLPYAWADGGGSVLLRNPRQDGTWKLDLDTFELVQVASATYLGITTE